MYTLSAKSAAVLIVALAAGAIDVLPADAERLTDVWISEVTRPPRRCRRRGQVGLRPGDVEERNAIQQWLRSSGRCLLGRRGRSTHPVRHWRRLPNLPECSDRQAHPDLWPE